MDRTGPSSDLAVVIVSYGSAPFIPACLRTVYAHAGPITIDAVIADNDPRVDLATALSEEFPQVRVLKTDNRGFGAGNNDAYAITDARQVLFLNPDTEIRRGLLAQLVATLDEDPTIGLLGCRQVDPTGRLCPSMRRFPSAGRAAAEALASERLLGHRSPGHRVLDPAAYDRETECDWVSGSFMLARTEALHRAGAFDERFFLFSEEVDLCLRVRRCGFRIVHSPAVEILHHAGRAGLDARLQAQQGFAHRQYAEKHLDGTQRAAFVAALAAGYAARATAARLRGPRGHAQHEAALGALRTVTGRAPSPFAVPAVRDPRPADPVTVVR